MKSLLCAFAAAVLLAGTAAAASPERASSGRSLKAPAGTSSPGQKDAPGDGPAASSAAAEKSAAPEPGKPTVTPAAVSPVPESTPSSAPVAPQAAPAPPSVAPTPSPADSEMPPLASDFPVTRALGGLGIVVCLMIGGFFATRKLAPQLFRKPAPQKTLKIIETLSMGDKRSISVVQFEGKRYLIGNTGAQISLLSALPEAALPAQPGNAAAEVKAEGPRAIAAEKFRNIFEMEKRNGSGPAPRPKTIPPDVRAKMRQLRESLEQ